MYALLVVRLYWRTIHIIDYSIPDSSTTTERRKKCDKSEYSGAVKIGEAVKRKMK